MAKINYSDKLKDPRWQKKRLEILQRDGWKCSLCGDSETSLNVHHKAYSGDPWEAEDNSLTTLCEHCHTFVTTIGTPEIEPIIAIKKFIYDSEIRMFSLSRSGMLFCLQVEGGKEKSSAVIFNNEFDELILFRNEHMAKHGNH